MPKAHLSVQFLALMPLGVLPVRQRKGKLSHLGLTRQHPNPAGKTRNWLLRHPPPIGFTFLCLGLRPNSPKCCFLLDRGHHGARLGPSTMARCSPQGTRSCCLKRCLFAVCPLLDPGLAARRYPLTAGGLFGSGHIRRRAGATRSPDSRPAGMGEQKEPRSHGRISLLWPTHSSEKQK
ncbi:hypothetical protein M441DRAFT_56188 [Trichoderma asperellum CBS 433.97]|uniref:Uncharacterized protein n=1 Tax=Trichoderma asperellum (strain ATCC 204424 / CBS 433.97 / NBRC 101777) TaxID=1042311 RepID=A0A2T3ZEB9_TRIA4|nr:hypothetical protein M441DRAFT_56188 [Trichoderma asperellum CBS 433.97]PTB43145.1 hypothetical protein M441DRAFT_56188 [Trichoderma asperellum CBS 433.97]